MTMQRIALVRAMFLVIVAAALTGCAQSAPDKNTFAMMVKMPAVEGHRVDADLHVAPVNVLRPYSGRSFVYRVGENRFELDYYNQFVASPSDLLTGLVAQSLADHGLFRAVVMGNEGLAPTYHLETTITELAGDYRKASAPAGVIAARFIVVRDDADGSHIAGQWTFEESVPAKDHTPKALVDAWDQAMEKVLARLGEELAKLPPDAAKASPQSGESSAVPR